MSTTLCGHLIEYRAHRYECLRCGARLLSMMQFNGRECPGPREVIESDVPQPVGRPQGGMKSEVGKAAYWRMQYESAIGALADLIAENTENVEFARDFYSHNADLLSDYWRAEFTRVFPPEVGQP